jgi:transcriptional regulator with XRE-family HTH domain
MVHQSVTTVYAFAMPPRKKADETRDQATAARKATGEATVVEKLDLAALGRLVREHRGDTSLRQAAREARVSFSTMARVESGHQPDLASFTQLCAWIGQPPSRFFTPVAAKDDEPLVAAITHLSRDPRLDREASAKLIDTLTKLYEKLASAAAPEPPLVACHLRAASVMRPGVPQRLGDALVEMHTALEQLVSAERL